MKGKERCKILKEIRAKIAEENGIEFAVSECSHKGDCLGTCPKCESEVRYLERELDLKKKLGKSIAVAGVAAGITLSSVGCTYIEEKLNGNTLQGDMQVEETFEETDGVLVPESETELEITGDLAPEKEEEILMGEPVQYFLPLSPEEYEGYDEFFVNECLRGENINSVRELWGEADMCQEKPDESVNSYFTDTMDVVIYFESVSGTITRAELIINE